MLLRKRNSINVNRTLFFLLSFFVLIPFGKFHDNPEFHLVNSFLTIILFLYYCVIYISKNIKLSPINIVSIFYLTYIYGYSIYLGTLSSFSEPFIIITLILFLCYAYKYYERDLLLAALLFYLLFGAIQLYLEYMYPYVSSDNTEDWLVQGKNYVVRIFLPGMMFVILNSLRNNNSILNMGTLVPLGLLTLTIFMSKSSTGIIGLAVFLLLIILFRNRNSKWLTINLFLIVTIGISLSFILFNYQQNFEKIFNLFGKDSTLTYRTDVWQYAIYNIIEHPWFGTGVGSIMVGDDILGEIHHAHQYWLNSLTTTGIVGLTLLLIIYLLANKNLNLQNFNNTQVKILVITIGSFLVMGIDESLTNSYMLIPILNLSCIPLISNKIAQRI